jgi:hypothetical protein
MANPAYTAKRFEFPSSQVGRGNYMANALTQFFALNPSITVVDISTNWREGRSRSDTLYLTLLFRGGGVPGRNWAVQFQNTGSTTAEDEATAFFLANPTFVPVKTVRLSRPDSQPRNRKLLTIFMTRSQAQPPCLLNAPAGAPAVVVAQGAYGSMYDTLDFTRPALPTLNLGNAAWPAGGTNLLVRALDANPDLCSWGGIAPCCFGGGTFVTPPPPVGNSLCDACIDPELLTIPFP